MSEDPQVTLMLDPNGNPGQVSADKVEAAQKAGYTSAVIMTGPSGEHGAVSVDKVPAARKSNYAVTNQPGVKPMLSPKGELNFVLPNETEQWQKSGHIPLNDKGKVDQGYLYSKHGLDVKGKASEADLNNAKYYDTQKGNYAPNTSTAGDMVENNPYEPSDEALKFTGVDPEAYRKNKSELTKRGLTGGELPSIDKDGNIVAPKTGWEGFKDINPIRVARTFATLPITATGGILKAFIDDPRSAEEQKRFDELGSHNNLTRGLNRLIDIPAEDEIAKAKATSEEDPNNFALGKFGRTSNALAHNVAGAIPVIGPMGASIGEGLWEGSGNEKAEALGNLGAIAFPEASLLPTKVAGKLIGKAAKAGTGVAMDLGAAGLSKVASVGSRALGRVAGKAAIAGVSLGADFVSGMADTLTKAAGDKIDDVLSKGTPQEIASTIKNIRDAGAQKLQEAGIVGEKATAALNDLTNRVHEHILNASKSVAGAMAPEPNEMAGGVKDTFNKWASDVKERFSAMPPPTTPVAKAAQYYPKIADVATTAQMHGGGLETMSNVGRGMPIVSTIFKDRFDPPAIKTANEIAHQLVDEVTGKHMSSTESGAAVQGAMRDTISAAKGDVANAVANIRNEPVGTATVKIPQMLSDSLTKLLDKTEMFSTEEKGQLIKMASGETRLSELADVHRALQEGLLKDPLIPQAETLKVLTGVDSMMGRGIADSGDLARSQDFMAKVFKSTKLIDATQQKLISKILKADPESVGEYARAATNKDFQDIIEHLRPEQQLLVRQSMLEKMLENRSSKNGEIHLADLSKDIADAKEKLGDYYSKAKIVGEGLEKIFDDTKKTNPNKAWWSAVIFPALGSAWSLMHGESIFGVISADGVVIAGPFIVKEIMKQILKPGGMAELNMLQRFFRGTANAVDEKDIKKFGKDVLKGAQNMASKVASKIAPEPNEFMNPIKGVKDSINNLKGSFEKGMTGEEPTGRSIKESFTEGIKRQQEKQVLSKTPLANDPQATEHVNNIGQKLGLKVPLKVVQGGGARAGMSGIYVGADLISQLSEPELAGFIAHEAAHVELNHTGVIKGNLAQRIPVYSRSLEAAADKLAVKKLMDAGYDPSEYANGMEKMWKAAVEQAKQQGITVEKLGKMDPHHPPMLDRIEDVKKAAPIHPGNGDVITPGSLDDQALNKKAELRDVLEDGLKQGRRLNMAKRVAAATGNDFTDDVKSLFDKDKWTRMNSAQQVAALGRAGAFALPMALNPARVLETLKSSGTYVSAATGSAINTALNRISQYKDNVRDIKDWNAKDVEGFAKDIPPTVLEIIRGTTAQDYLNKYPQSTNTIQSYGSKLGMAGAASQLIAKSEGAKSTGRTISTVGNVMMDPTNPYAWDHAVNHLATYLVKKYHFNQLQALRKANELAKEYKDTQAAADQARPKKLIDKE